MDTLSSPCRLSDAIRFWNAAGSDRRALWNDHYLGPREKCHLEWTTELNQRPFELIDRQIQGTLTPEESIELAGLTQLMRDHVDAEAQFPIQGARELHRRLLDGEAEQQ